MLFHSRDEVWPGQVPRSSNGAVRPLLRPQIPWLTVHYTGAGVWLDPGDTAAEARAIQLNAVHEKKPWEYNYIIDGEGGVWEYAGGYQAAHSEGENADAIGVLLLVGLSDSANLRGFEKPTNEMVMAFREFRRILLTSGAISLSHEVRKHKDMPGAVTICPGPEVIARWSELTTPYIPPKPTPPQPIEEIMPLFAKTAEDRPGTAKGAVIVQDAVTGRFRLINGDEWNNWGQPNCMNASGKTWEIMNADLDNFYGWSDHGPKPPPQPLTVSLSGSLSGSMSGSATPKA